MAAEPWFDELAEFLRIPSISADPAHAATSRTAGEWVCDFVRGAGRRGGARRLARAAARDRRDPRVDGGDRRRRSSATATSTCSRPTRSSCGRASRSSPRSATATSTGAAPSTTRASSTCCSPRRASSRAPASCRSTCASAATARRRPAATRSSSSSPPTSAAADAAIIFDSGMIRRDVPAFNLATRGLVYFHVTLRTGERDLHSGIYGGAALNAAHALDARRSTRSSPRDGRLAEPLRQGIAAADRGGARRLARAARRRRRARGAGRAADRPARGRGVLPAARSPSRRST